MPELVPWFLATHVLLAIVAYGPTFTYPLIRSLAASEREHANFATRVSAAITDRVVLPLAVLQGLAGVGLIWSLQIDLLAADHRWLLAGVALYLLTLSFSFFVQRPRVHRIIEWTSGSTPPPPELPQLAASLRRGGMLLSALLVTIVLLMVLKPGS